MNHSTLSFVLRWQALPFIGGLLLSIFAGYALWTYAPSASTNAQVTAGADIFGPPAYCLTLILGLGLMGYAWWKAYALRNGL